MNNPSKFNKRVQWEEKRRRQNEEGHWIEEWTDSILGLSWVQIRNIRGNEFIMAGANQVKVSARINTRYRKDIEEKYYKLGEKLRIRLGTRIFDIIYINNLEERNVEFEILVNEVR